MAPLEPLSTYYGLLGVDEEATSDELVRAYRQLALEQHPDKGGDAADFAELSKAFKTLDNAATRDVYDADLAKARERAELVKDIPAGLCGTSAPNFAGKQAQAPMPRQKTEPTPGSKRQGKMRTFQPGGKPECCSLEWKGLRSGQHYLKMLTDQVTEEKKVQILLEKFVVLPRGKDKRREWIKSVKGEQRQELKAAAKKKEAKEMEKWQTWLSAPKGPSRNIREALR